MGDWLSLIDMESPHDLSLLVQWLWANRIFLNTTKAEIILFRTKKRLNVNNLNFRISGQNWDTIKQTKYFNICLDKILKWKFHTEQIKSKLSSVYSSCGFLAKLRYYVKYDLSKENILQSLIQMRYGLQVWGQNKNTTFKEIENFKTKL